MRTILVILGLLISLQLSAQRIYFSTYHPQRGSFIYCCNRDGTGLHPVFERTWDIQFLSIAHRGNPPLLVYGSTGNWAIEKVTGNGTSYERIVDMYSFIGDWLSDVVGDTIREEVYYASNTATMYDYIVKIKKTDGTVLDWYMRGYFRDQDIGGITLDHEHSVIFFTVHGAQNRNGIYKINSQALSGSSAVQIFSDTKDDFIKSPGTILYRNNRLYWSDFGGIYTSLASGEFPNLLVSHTGSCHSITLDPARSKIYWATGDGIKRANMIHGGDVEDIVSGFSGWGINGIVFDDISPPVIVDRVDNYSAVGFGDFYNFPNPFSGKTWLSMKLDREENIRISVYDLSGNLHDMVYPGIMGSGRHSIEYSNDNLPSGTYVIKLEGDGLPRHNRMIVIKGRSP